MKRVILGADETYLEEALRKFMMARQPVALTGAGISVASGIPDFRSPGGLWSKFSPNEYATVDVFFSNPGKAWQLYRELGRTLEGKKPNAAHYALARLEDAGMLHGVVTQNVDMLHQMAGSSVVLEIHGEHRNLQCLHCGELEEAVNKHYGAKGPPVCRHCGFVLKPNVVLFGESVRKMDEINNLLQQCDLLLVIGTSAQVHPAAGLPALVKQNNGLVFEFNIEETNLTRGYTISHVSSDYLFMGDAAVTLELFADLVLGS